MIVLYQRGLTLSTAVCHNGVCVRMILEPVILTLLRDGSTAYPEPLTLKGPLNMALKYIDYTDYVHIHRLLCLNTFYLYQEDCGVMPTR